VTLAFCDEQLRRTPSVQDPGFGLEEHGVKVVGGK
jgi:hypothetical protein